MKTRIFFLSIVACHMVGFVALGHQSTVQIPGDSDRDQADQKLGVIRGRVFAADGGYPLAKVILSIRSTGRFRPRTVRTNARGEYEFRDLEDGKYLLSATRNGYVAQDYGQKISEDFRMYGSPTHISLKPGEALNGLDFRLIRGGVVEGRVVDQDNEPLLGVSVELSRYRRLGQKYDLIRVGKAETDDRGQFRLYSIPPGSYVLSATLRLLEFGLSGRNSLMFPVTYYPGVLHPKEATKVEVTAGTEVGGFHLTLIDSPSYSVSGRVLTAEGYPARSVRITASQKPSLFGADFFSLLAPRAMTDRQGEFKVSGLLPGRYRLHARSVRGEDTKMASAALDVTDQDLTGLTLVLGMGAEITGRIVTDRKDSNLDQRHVWLRIVPVAAGGRLIFGRRSTTVEEDFTFRISNLPEGVYRLVVSLRPGNHYVESIRVDGQDITDRSIEVGSNDWLEGVEVHVSSEGARLSGVVEQPEGRKAAKGVTVLVFAADAQYRGLYSRFTRTTPTDQFGRFSLEGLAPGEYLLCALVDHEAGHETDLDYLGSLEKESKKIDLSPGEMSHERLMVLSAPKIN